MSRLHENAQLSIENPRASRALKQALDTGFIWFISLAQPHLDTLVTFGPGKCKF